MPEENFIKLSEYVGFMQDVIRTMRKEKLEETQAFSIITKEYRERTQPVFNFKPH